MSTRHHHLHTTTGATSADTATGSGEHGDAHLVTRSRPVAAVRSVVIAAAAVVIAVALWSDGPTDSPGVRHRIEFIDREHSPRHDEIDRDVRLDDLGPGEPERGDLDLDHPPVNRPGVDR